MTIPHSRTYAITLHQPWAWAVIFGGKNIENRSRAIGPCELLIHAGKTYDPEGEEIVLRNTGRKRLPPLARTGGLILGRVRLVEAFYTPGTASPDAIEPWAEAGCWNHRLVAPQRADPMIECRGYPSLWYPPQGWEKSFNRRAR
jgi:hypothetical protein